MNSLIRLRLIGITYNQIESGVYALILEEENGNRRIPIIIGYPEAQAIECKLQEVKTPRPLTHDLMGSIMTAFGISLKSVLIYRLPNGVFAADLTVCDNESCHTVDSRSSDAIALAIRVNAPIYTTEELLEEVGFRPKEKKEGTTRNTDVTSDISLDELKRLMNQAAEQENYEEAARLKREIDNRKAL